MAGPFDFTGQNIEDTYQRLVQVSGSGFCDGTGSAVSIGGSQNLQQVTEQGAVTTIPITASIISASGEIFATDFHTPIGINDGYHIGDGKPILCITDGGALNLGANHSTYQAAGVNIFVTGSDGSKGLFLDTSGNITASGDISASGTIVGSNLSGTNTGDQDLSPYLLSSQTSSFAITGSDVLFTNVTASTVSASGDIIGGGLDISGPENSHIKVGTYNVGFDQASIPSTQITGSGLIISGAMADQDHHNFLKIGEIELVDVKTLLNSNTFLIHNVDDFILTSGSDGGNITTTNLLFRHQGNAFNIYQNGVSKISMAANGNLVFNGDTITFTPTSATQMKAPNSTSNSHILSTAANPNDAPQDIQSIDADNFFSEVYGAVTASVVSASGDIIANSITASIHGGTF